MANPLMSVPDTIDLREDLARHKSASATVPDTIDPNAPSPEDPGLLGRKNDDGWLSSAAKGAGTAVLKGLSHIPGMGGDIAGLLDLTKAYRAVPAVKSVVKGTTYREEADAQDKRLAERRADPNAWELPSGEDVYKWFADKTGLGEYKPVSLPGKYLMTGVEGTVGMLGPGGPLGSAVKAALPKYATEGVRAGLTQTGKTALKTAAPVGGGLSVAGEALTDFTQDPLAGAAPIVIPVAAVAGKGAYSYLKGTPAERARSTLVGALENPRETIRQAIDEPGRATGLTGAPRTTAQAFPDAGLAQLENALGNSQVASGRFKNELDSNRRVRDESMRTTIEGLAPDGADIDAPSRILGLHQTAWQQHIADLNQALIRARDPVEAAAIKRDIAAAHRRAYDQETSRLYDTARNVDAEGSPANAQRAAAALARDFDTQFGGNMPPALREWTERVLLLPETATYRQLVTLDKAIEAQRRTAMFNNNDELAGWFGRLKSGVMDDLRAVPGAADAIDAAKAHYIEGKRIFENNHTDLGLRQRYGEFRMPPETVANKMFVRGDGGYNAATSWLQAAGHDPRALGALQDIAVARLRDRTTFGAPLTQAQLDGWKKNYAPALRAIDEMSPGFSQSFDNLTNAARRLEQLELSAAGRFLGVQDPAAVQATIHSIVNNNSGVSQLRGLFANVEAPYRDMVRAGLQRAHAQHMSQEFIGARLEEVRGAKFAQFARDREAQLRELYGPRYANIRRMADELANVERVAQVPRNAIGSPTGFQTRAELHAPARENPTIMQSMLNAGLWSSVFGPGAGTAIAGATHVSKQVLNWLETGRDSATRRVIEEAMINPHVFRQLMMRTYNADGTRSEKAVRALGEIMNRIGPASYAAIEHEEKRQERASGGRVGIDHAAKAAELVKMVDKVRKKLSSSTEPLLKAPDEAITKALAVANEAI